MKKILSIVILATMPLTASYADGDVRQYTDKSKAVVKEFAAQLKGELGKSMKAGGPLAAIEVCNTRAPAIAEALSSKHGMKVARTSLKTRNSANAPDAWETGVLNKFEERRAAGESPAEMAYFEIVEANGKKKFRFMKAIGMPPLSEMPCLKCHGENIDSTVTSKLDELYPEDKARDYKVGQIRGAFSLSQSLD